MQAQNQSEPFVWSDLRKHVNANRKVRQKEIKKYEKKYLHSIKNNKNQSQRKVHQNRQNWTI